MKQLYEYSCYEQENIFDIMQRGLRAKADLMRRYPHLAAFTLKCYYEKDEEVCGEIQKIIGRTASFKANESLLKLDRGQFVEGVDIKLMYLDMYYMSVGYLWEKTQQGNLDVDRMEKDFAAIINFWKKIYLRRDEDVRD